MAITAQRIILLVICLCGHHTAAQRTTLPCYQPGSCCWGAESSGVNADTVGLQRRLANLEARQAQVEARQAQLEVKQAENPVSCPEPEIPCEWKLVFKIVSNVNERSHPLWSAADTPSDMPGDPEVAGQGHYRSRDVDVWETLNVTQVKVSLYTFSPNMETRDIIFNGTGSDKNSWFSKDRLVSSPWTDLKTATTDFFSIDGDWHYAMYGSTTRIFDRRFHIALTNNCASERGWLTVLDQNSNFCTWERSEDGRYPRIVYSKLPGSVDYSQDSANVGMADVMAIFIKTCDN
ncbi:PREDICTED: uncharacterized protein LOC109477277 [Branchiostoma belcheri]|uniref:Uncharacterized protein LOC109477277 n=1 Tax=Branchiostoma belcheri TaxID=7741 RepID=A0A6P4ZWC9_BRABE|nr:PREDICTED: uncharacterized protein LOC109477277 [Branchiostoma belcheri]